MGFGDTIFHKMEYEEGQRMIALFKDEEINREIMEVLMRGHDPMKIEKYKLYLTRDASPETGDESVDEQSMKIIGEYLKNG